MGLPLASPPAADPVTVGGPVFHFVQVEFPWPLGPPDGRYLVRAPDDPDGPPTHVLVLATLGAPRRARLAGRGRTRAAPEPDPAPVATGRATIIDVSAPLGDAAAGEAWLRTAGEDELRDGLAVLDRMLHAFRLAAADPHAAPPGRRQALVARVGFGAGEQVADGQWSAARELPAPAPGRRRRARMLAPQARLAALLGARETALICEELTLRARADIDAGRPREAALQLIVALDAALAELAVDPRAAELAERLAELRAQREAVAAAAQAALAGMPEAGQLEAVTFTLGRLEAALRARAAAGA